MTADDTTPQTSAERAAEVIRPLVDTIYGCAIDGGYMPPDQGESWMPIADRIARALADAHLLVDPADRDAIKAPLVREIKRLQDQIARAAMEPGQDRQKAMHAYAARAERAEAEVADLRATLDRVRALADRWDRWGHDGVPIRPSTAAWYIRDALDGGES